MAFSYTSVRLVAPVVIGHRRPLGWVVTLASEGRASEQPPAGQNGAFGGSVFLNGLHTVLTTGGEKPARRGQQRRDDVLVQPNGKDHGRGRHGLLPTGGAATTCTLVARGIFVVVFLTPPH